MPIRKKLLLAFGVIGFLAGVLGLLAVRINSGMAHDIAQISHAAIDEANAADGMSEALHDLEIELLRQSRYAHGKTADAQRSEEITAAVARFEANLSLFQKTTENALATAEGEPADIAEANQDVRLYKEIKEKFVLLKSTVLSNQNEGIDTDSGPNSTNGRHADILGIVEAYRETTSKDLQRDVDSVAAAIRQANVILIGSTSAIILLGGVMAWLISLSVSYPLAVLTKAAEQISRGRLDTKVAIRSKDEIGLLAKTFNQMTTDLGVTTVSRDYLNSILKSMVNSLIVIGLDRTIQSVNTATLRLLGYLETELVGLSMDDVLGEGRKNPSSLLNNSGSERLQNNVETFYCTKTGELISVTFSASELRDPAGIVMGIVCIAQDISARKKAELELEQTGKKLLEASHQAGMAEVAASVLHNVGNVLNSVNVSTSLIGDLIRGSKTANLGAAVELMRTHADDLPHFLSSDPKGKLLPGYLSDLATHLTNEDTALLKEIESLASNVAHIKEIVGMQQNYARVSGIAEKCDLVELLENAVRINGDSLERHQITLIREYSDIPSVVTEKHKVLQIFVNLIRNAKYACGESEKSEKRVILRVVTGDGGVDISIIDNGVGIPEENLTRIFSHGFTTKKDGHGFGLHSGALAAKELGGRLSVFSGGPGAGSAFVLNLPAYPEGAKNDC